MKKKLFKNTNDKLNLGNNILSVEKVQPISKVNRNDTEFYNNTFAQKFR